MTIITGTAGPDTLAGSAAADLILGLAGGDRLTGLQGSDTILGGSGDDSIVGDIPALPPYVTPADEGNLILAGAGNDAVVAGLGTDRVFGGSGEDTLLGGIGSSLSSFIEGGASANWSLDRADLLDGGAGRDLLDGAGGNDTLLGGAGADTLIGSAGVDLLDGGAGHDVFLFARALGVFGGPDSGVGPGNRDVILDFQDGRDVIDLSHLASANAFPGNPVPGASFLGEGSFAASFALQVRTAYEDGNTIIQLVSAQRQDDPTAPPPLPTGPEAEIALIGIHHLAASDFLLG